MPFSPIPTDLQAQHHAKSDAENRTGRAQMAQVQEPMAPAPLRVNRSRKGVFMLTGRELAHYLGRGIEHHSNENPAENVPRALFVNVTKARRLGGYNFFAASRWLLTSPWPSTKMALH